jgi:MFS family permease
VWILNLGMAVNTVGSGMVMPFLLIYLHNVRGFSLGAAGLVPAVHFATALVFGIAAGIAFDRLGGRETAAASLILLAVGFGAFPFVDELWHALALGALAGIGRGAFWPSYSGLLAALTPPELRPSAYAVQRVAGNLAIALGSLVAGLVLSTSAPGTFTIVFVASAVLNAVFAVMIGFLPRVAVEPTARGAGGYRVVSRDRAFVGLIAINFVFVTAGVALLTTVLPVFAKTTVGVSELIVGLLFVVNTVAIVLGQFPVTRLLRGESRMRALALMGGVWALSWLLVLTAAGASSSAVAVGFLFVAVAAFALGECVHGVVQGPLVSDLAPAALRGRYMAAWLTTAQLGFAVGPGLGAFVLEQSPALLWLGAAAVCVAAALAALGLDQALPAAVRRSPARPPATT